MIKSFPKTDLKALPISTPMCIPGKKKYASLSTMISKTGIGLDHKTKMIEATDEAWEAHVKVHPNARLMRHKTWPYYEDWFLIFGKDRANEAGAEDIGEASSTLTRHQPADAQMEDVAPPGYTTSFDGFTAENDPSPAPDRPESSCPGTKRTNTRKRKMAEFNESLSESVSKFCNDASQRLGDIAEWIGYEVVLGM